MLILTEGVKDLIVKVLKDVPNARVSVNGETVFLTAENTIEKKTISENKTPTSKKEWKRRLVEVDSQEMTVAEAAKKLGLARNTLYTRINKGIPLEGIRKANKMKARVMAS